MFIPQSDRHHAWTDRHRSRGAVSPVCFPMHDHSEPSQVAQGGNYNCGLISGIDFIGDRNTPGAGS